MPRHWEAQWIWQKDNRQVNAHLLFRRDFELASVPSHARLFIAVESRAVLYLNGQRVHVTTSISYPGHHYYEEAEVGHALQAGTNQLAVLARYIGIPSGGSFPQDPGLLCELVMEQDGRGPLVIASDASWKVLSLDAWRGVQRRSHWFNLDLVEVMDYRRLPDGWPMVEDLSGFEDPQVLRYPGVRFPHVEARPFPKADLADFADFTVVKAGLVDDQSAGFDIAALAVSEEDIEPTDLGICCPSDFTIQPMAEGKAGALLLDLGRYATGYPRARREPCCWTLVAMQRAIQRWRRKVARAPSSMSPMRNASAMASWTSARQGSTQPIVTS